MSASCTKRRMPKVTGIGGFFFKVADASKTAEWFSKTLDLPTEAWGRAFPGAIERIPREGVHGARPPQRDVGYFDPRRSLAESPCR